MSQSQPDSHINRIESAFVADTLDVPWNADAHELPVEDRALHCQVNDFSVGLIPENYEPRYPYPLILWLPGSECDTDEALEHIGRLSPQNYVGLAVEDCVVEDTVSDSACAQPHSLDLAVDQLRTLVEIENRIVTAVRSFREMINVHTERVFLAGFGTAAETAMLVSLHQPEWFGGCISLNGRYPAAASLFPTRPEIEGKRFWLSSPGGRSGVTSATATRKAAGTLVASGADVTTHIDDSGRSLSPGLLRVLDKWLMDGILSGS